MSPTLTRGSETFDDKKKKNWRFILIKKCPLVRIGPMSRQVRDILKKTKGVVIITIALHVLLASWYISRHGRLVQISNNQASPRGEKF